MKDLTDVKCCLFEYIDNEDKTNSIIGTEWWNGEGIDITLHDGEILQLSDDQIQAIATIAAAMCYIDTRSVQMEAENIISESIDRNKKKRAYNSIG